MFVCLCCSAQLQSWKTVLKMTFPLFKYWKGTPKTIAGKCRHDLTDVCTNMLDDSYQMDEEDIIQQYKNTDTKLTI